MQQFLPAFKALSSLFSGRATHTKNYQEMKLLTGPYLWENTAPKKCTIFACKNGRTQGGNLVFTMWAFFFFAFEGLLLLKHFQAYFQAGLVARCFTVLGATVLGASLFAAFKRLSSLFSGGLGCQMLQGAWGNQK